LINCKKWLFAVVLSLYTGGVCLAGDADVIKKYSELYKTGIKKYEDDFLSQKQRGCINYIKHLKDQKKALQQAGDLDGWAAFNKELKRFLDEPVIRNKVSSPASLRKVQDAYTRYVNKIESQKNNNIVALKGRYIAKLEELQKKWTKDGNFNAAYAARDEIKRISSDEAIISIEKALEDKNRGAEEQHAGGAAKDIPKPPTSNIRLEGGGTIYPPGLSPRPVGMSQRPVVLSRTKVSPWPSVISAKINVSYDKSVSLVRARIALRTSNSSVVLGDLRVLLQYYSKPAAGSGGYRTRSCITKNMRLPYLGKRLVTIDVAPVRVAPNVRTYRSSGHRRTIGSDSGKSYDYILTVFDSDGKLVYQGTSNKSMADKIEVPSIREGDIEGLRAAYHEATAAYERASSAYHADSCNADLRQAYEAARERRNEARQEYHSVRDSCCH